MKALRLFLPLAATALAAAKPLTPSAPSPLDPFGRIGADYKQAQELSEGFFNPFKSRALGTARREAATVTNEAVAAAFGRRGLSGLLYAPEARADRIVVGDQVFAPGDELAFPDGDPGDAAPLVAGATVVLRAVGHDQLQFDVTPEGEPARRFALPLRAFWRR